jgi:hypothetical protein
MSKKEKRLSREKSKVPSSPCPPQPKEQQVDVEFTESALNSKTIIENYFEWDALKMDIEIYGAIGKFFEMAKYLTDRIMSGGNTVLTNSAL